MSKNLSANTLFHFTKSIDNIVSILENNFYPRYCVEEVVQVMPEGYEINEVAIPMVCFCDIPLSQISNHINNYGGYAIGLSKEWGKRNKINPVMYTVPGAFPSTILRGIMQNLSNTLKEIKNQENKNVLCSDIVKQSINFAGVNLLDFVQYLKPYEGDRINKNSSLKESVRFYDEREWRYIPDPSSAEEILGKHSWVLGKYIYDNEKTMSEYGNKLQNLHQLKFEPKDIRYIIVQNESEILELERKITYIKGEKYSRNAVTLLSTRIITMEQILSDF